MDPKTELIANYNGACYVFTFFFITLYKFGDILCISIDFTQKSNCIIAVNNKNFK